MENDNASDDKNVRGENETETSFSVSTRVPGGSSREDDSTTMKAEAAIDGRPCFVPFCALLLYIMAFLGFVCSFALCVNLSVAIVAMVNHTALGETTNSTTNTSGTDRRCPRDAALQQSDDGEFTWTRHQQAAALATYYYGYAVSQVGGDQSQYVQLELQKILRPSNGRLASLTNMAALWDYRHSRRSSDVILRHFYVILLK